jgi:hypothetical protein
MWLVSWIRDIGDEEAQHGGSTIAFMKNLVPAAPVLLLGFICMEGKELVSYVVMTTERFPGGPLYFLYCNYEEHLVEQ